MAKNQQAASQKEPASVPIRTNSIARIILITIIPFEIFLVWADYYYNFSMGTSLNPIQRLFNITREDGLASWFSATQTALIAVTFWFQATLARDRRIASVWQRRGWLVLALFFAYMTFDDGSNFHERIGSSFKQIEQESATPETALSGFEQFYRAFPSYPWQFLFLPFFVSLGIFMAVFLFKEFRTTGLRVVLFISLGLLAAAVGLDFIEGLDRMHPWNVYEMIDRRYDWDPFTVTHFHEIAFESLRHFSKSLEEFLEMFSSTLLWVALLRHMGRSTQGAAFRIVDH